MWDYGKYDTNDFLGEVVLELGAARFDEEAEWHPLTGHSEHRHIGYVKQISIHIYVCIYFPMREVDRRFESVKFIPALFFFISRREKNYEGGKFVVENCKEIVNICREY